MKKILFMLFAFALLFVASCRQQTTTATSPPDRVEYVYAVDQSVDAPAMLVQDISPPEADYGDILNLPGKDADKSVWIYWGISVAVVLYEMISRLVPTMKSRSIITGIFNLFNLILKDRTANGGIFKVNETKPVKRE